MINSDIPVPHVSQPRNEPRNPAQDDAHPVLLHLTKTADRARFEALLASGAVRETHDRIDGQLEELVRCLRPGAPLSDAQLASAVGEVCVPADRSSYGTWVWYPWSRRLVHVLPEPDFRRVRTDRNRNKISIAEQQHLLGTRIGVIGLSVGSSAALTCAMEGVGGSFRLADFDHLGLSNLNRLRAGVHDLGVPKTVLCARQMYEIDPYLDIELWSEGVTEDTLEGFFGDAQHPLDLLVEECDTPWVKAAAREHARSRRVPVLMDTNDRGMLDVERFDEEPGRALFHGRSGELTARDVRGLGPAATMAYLLQVCDESRLSAAMTDALGRIGESLRSWPQLASGVMLGGALVTDTARRILLGRPVRSGRYYVDLEELIGTAPSRAGVGALT
ncbi:ThiF family adenylyltransferase [Streptomyces sp. NBC_00859]|uniref:ThiF family adenylyltransferase n=1 Tax=Streptomyces sp. NBC_00859 TaxID=2903682 RepID=UPI003869E145|nr:ThiF family adenylyltransferase [Streptomyces sp. NBC_00859]